MYIEYINKNRIGFRIKYIMEKIKNIQFVKKFKKDM